MNTPFCCQPSAQLVCRKRKFRPSILRRKLKLRPVSKLPSQLLHTSDLSQDTVLSCWGLLPSTSSTHRGFRPPLRYLPLSQAAALFSSFYSCIQLFCFVLFAGACVLRAAAPAISSAWTTSGTRRAVVGASWWMMFTETYQKDSRDESGGNSVLTEVVIIYKWFNRCLDNFFNLNIFQRSVGGNQSQDAAPLAENRDLNGSIREVYV